MKSIIVFFLGVSFAVLSSFTVQSNIDQVIKALQEGNTSDLSKYFDEKVEISLPGKSDNYSKAQAIVILKDFFGNSGVRGFEVKHKGEQSGGQFCIGYLLTKTGKFRTTVFMKIKGQREVVKDIRFDAA